MYKKILFLCINIYKFLIKIKILKVKNMKRMKIIIIIKKIWMGMSRSNSNVLDEQLMGTKK